MNEQKKEDFEVVGGKRVCGKTTHLIRKSFETQIPILCPTRTMARIIHNQSQEMGLNIPSPITLDDMSRSIVKGERIERVLIDEVQILLREMLGVEVAAMSTSYKLNEFDSLRKEDVETNQHCKHNYNVLNDIKSKINRVCLDCGHNQTTYVTKKDYKAVITCPVCSGAFVDVWAKGKYTKGNKKPLIKIELEDINSIPKVTYDGRDITNRCHVDFKWITKSDECAGGAMFEIEYIDDNGVSHRVSKRVGVFG